MKGQIVADTARENRLESDVKAARRALVVLGMHRSGTSAMTRVLNLLGATLPDRLMPPLPNNNETGFWESEELAALSDELLQIAGMSWKDPSALPPSQLESAAIQTLIDRAQDLFARDFADTALFVLKDPRMCRLLPFWRAALERFGTPPSYVIIVRNPLEVAASLKARDAMLPARAHLLWLRHNLEAERHTRGERRCFVSYEALMRNWRSVADTVARQLDLTWPRDSHHAAVEIEHFLQPGLQHHCFSPADLEASSDTSPWVKTVFTLLLRAIDGDETDLTTTLDAICQELDLADRAFGPIVVGSQLALDNVGQQRQELLHQIQHLQQEAATARQKAEFLESERNHLADEKSNFERRLAEASTAHEREISQLDAELEMLKKELRDRDGEVARLDGGAAGLREELRQRDGQLARLGAENESLRSESETLRRYNDDLAAAHVSLEKRRGSLEKDLTATRQLLQEAKARADKLAELEERLAVRDFEIARRDRELDALEERVMGLTGALRDQHLSSRKMLHHILRAANFDLGDEPGS